MCCGGHLGQPVDAMTVAPSFWDCLVLKVEDVLGVTPLPPNASPEQVQKRIAEENRLRTILQVAVIATLALLVLPRLFRR